MSMEIKMDTSRWKSILVHREVYEEIKALSHAEGRTIGGQLRLVFDWYREDMKKEKTTEEKISE